MTGRGRAIVLIGFMGAGKSSAGRALAQRTGYPRFDIDQLVSKQFHLLITEIFARFGEEKFRDGETEVLRQLSGTTPAIIVTGGGIVLRRENVELLRELGTIVHLQADEETLFHRISRRTHRPLLQTENPRQTLAELLQQRRPHYYEAADAELDTSTLTHEEVVEGILKAIAEL